jgi:pentose-5-phosphate-3-epimerase
MGVSLSISLDPAIKAGRLREYLTEVNSWKKLGNISIHLDIMRKDAVGHDRCTDAEADWILKHAKLPVFVHYVTRDAVQKQSDGIIVMSVVPGESGRPFNENALENLAETRAKNPTAHIILDGGINADILKKHRDVILRNANAVVVGAFIYTMPDEKARAQTVRELLDILHKQS